MIGWIFTLDLKKFKHTLNGNFIIWKNNEAVKMLKHISQCELCLNAFYFKRKHKLINRYSNVVHEWKFKNAASYIVKHLGNNWVGNPEFRFWKNRLYKEFLDIQNT